MTTMSTLGEVRPEHDRPVDGDLVQLHYQRSYRQPVLDVWTACTDPAQLARWLGTVTLEGSDLLVALLDGPIRDPLRVRVERRIAPRELAASVEGCPLEMRFVQVGVVTTVELVRRQLSAADAAVVGPRWQYLLDRLGAHLEYRPLPRWADYPELTREYR